MAKKQKSEIVIDAFKAGEYPQGVFGPKELQEIMETYNPDVYEAPILIGHISDPSYQGKSAIPAFGWIGKVKQVGEHLKLVASEFSDQLKELIEGGFYKKVSAAFFQPNDPNNPTPGKWHLHHLAFLGGVPPAVKGLEQIAFAEMKGVGVEFAEVDASVMVDGEEIVEKVEELGVEDTLKTLAEYCGAFSKKVEDAFTSGAEEKVVRDRIMLAHSDMQGEIYSCIDGHFAFMHKLDGMEEKAEMSEKKSWLVEMKERALSIINQRKESAMDKEQEQKYQREIADLEAKVKEFSDADAARQAEAATKAEEVKKETAAAQVKEFCDTAVKENRMTPAMREKDEPLMAKLAVEAPDILVSFQEKYSVKLVPEGEVTELNEKDGNSGKQTPQLVVKAADYVKANPKEFSGLSQEKAVKRAVYFAGIGKIKL